MWPLKITVPYGETDSVHTFLSLHTVASVALSYVNQSTVTISTVINHHQQLCEQNSYMTGVGLIHCSLRKDLCCMSCKIKE